jgi:hypothetical protein
LAVARLLVVSFDFKLVELFRDGLHRCGTVHNSTWISMSICFQNATVCL